MNKKEIEEKIEKNIEYLRRNIPPDDIYIFTEQTFMAALYFLSKWSKSDDFIKECQEDEIARKWIVNISGFLSCRDLGLDINIDLGLESLEEDENNN